MRYAKYFALTYKRNANRGANPALQTFGNTVWVLLFRGMVGRDFEQRGCRAGRAGSLAPFPPFPIPFLPFLRAVSLSVRPSTPLRPRPTETIKHTWYPRTPSFLGATPCLQIRHCGAGDVVDQSGASGACRGGIQGRVTRRPTTYPRRFVYFSPFVTPSRYSRGFERIGSERAGKYRQEIGTLVLKFDEGNLGELVLLFGINKSRWLGIFHNPPIKSNNCFLQAMLYWQWSMLHVHRQRKIILVQLYHITFYKYNTGFVQSKKIVRIIV